MLKSKIIRNFSIVLLCLLIIEILRIYPVEKETIGNTSLNNLYA